MQALKATVLDDDKFALLAFPFTGPVPSPTWPGGVDLDGETFTHRTDIKPHWFKARPVDWHHGKDPKMQRTVIGKADNLREEDDGWWVDVWLDHGQRRLELIKKLAQKGATIFGSSEPIQDMVRVNKANGHIDVWPYLRQTLSTSPQNTHSVIRHMKADLLDIVSGGYYPSDEFWAEMFDSLHDLGLDLRTGAKAGQVVDTLGEALADADAQVQRVLTLYQSLRASDGDTSDNGSQRNARGGHSDPR